MEQAKVAPGYESAVSRLAGKFVQDVEASQSVDEIVGCRVRPPGQRLNVAERKHRAFLETFQDSTSVARQIEPSVRCVKQPHRISVYPTYSKGYVQRGPITAALLKAAFKMGNTVSL